MLSPMVTLEITPIQTFTQQNGVVRLFPNFFHDIKKVPPVSISLFSNVLDAVEAQRVPLHYFGTIVFGR